ncbi:GGDEF domain-containing protein [Marinomonas pollencensis]|uniref:diguanylate cyclase n=1 Tax=Marinomonas pollencensis TaxID=491954 RepID=A0A3E0DRB3_9GAMM|nr:GGDEF domain-containing protein [Marinomonas pollencensis]REG85675.1 diguanylate cyclase (GGDEF)-like protein [Marinomonas pollencensis]
MQNESPTKATELMQKAVPMMLKLDVAPTPYNYGIWYEYVSNRNQKLNQIMDGTLRKLGHLPGFLARELFHEFLLPEEFQQGNGQKEKLANIVDQAATSSKAMGKGLDELNLVLTKSRKILNRADKAEHIDNVINYLEKGALAATHKANQFNQSLDQVHSELAKLKAELDDMKKQNDVDELTQLVNQKGFERRLYEWLPQAEDDISIILLDIDNLATINKQFGKRAGTALIRYIAEIIKSLAVEKSVLARFEGGTYGILLNEATLDFTHRLAELLRLQISEQKIRYKQSKVHMPQVTVSIGIATLLGQEGPEDFLKRARKNLLRAKQSGKNCTSDR